jgi:DNA-binding FadR family transcriptional regulator
VFRARSRSYQVFTLPDGPHIKRASDEDHRAIATALSNRDPVAAAGAASAHVAHTEKWLTAFLRQESAADGSPAAKE